MQSTRRFISAMFFVLRCISGKCKNKWFLFLRKMDHDQQVFSTSIQWQDLSASLSNSIYLPVPFSCHWILMSFYADEGTRCYIGLQLKVHHQTFAFRCLENILQYNRTSVQKKKDYSVIATILWEGVNKSQIHSSSWTHLPQTANQIGGSE